VLGSTTIPALDDTIQITSTLGLSGTSENNAANSINLANNTYNISSLSGSPSDPYIAAASIVPVSTTLPAANVAANLNGFATVKNLQVGTHYVSVWVACNASFTFTNQSVNLVIMKL
jgi:hypothetical protein